MAKREPKNPIDPATGKRRRGNPNFVPGHQMGGRPKADGLKIRNGACAEFMEKEGWALLFDACRLVGHRNQVPALNLAANYGYGKPAESMDLTSGGREIKSIGDFLSQPSDESGGTTGA